jgi:hypothetical protein
MQPNLRAHSALTNLRAKQPAKAARPASLEDLLVNQPAVNLQFEALKHAVNKK